MSSGGELGEQPEPPSVQLPEPDEFREFQLRVEFHPAMSKVGYKKHGYSQSATEKEVLPGDRLHGSGQQGGDSINNGNERGSDHSPLPSASGSPTAISPFTSPLLRGDSGGPSFSERDGVESFGDEDVVDMDDDNLPAPEPMKMEPSMALDQDTAMDMDTDDEEPGMQKEEAQQRARLASASETAASPSFTANLALSPTPLPFSQSHPQVGASLLGSPSSSGYLSPSSQHRQSPIGSPLTINSPIGPTFGRCSAASASASSGSSHEGMQSRRETESHASSREGCAPACSQASLSSTPSSSSSPSSTPASSSMSASRFSSSGSGSSSAAHSPPGPSPLPSGPAPFRNVDSPAPSPSLLQPIPPPPKQQVQRSLSASAAPFPSTESCDSSRSLGGAGSRERTLLSPPPPLSLSSSASLASPSASAGALSAFPSASPSLASGGSSSFSSPTQAGTHAAPSFPSSSSSSSSASSSSCSSVSLSAASTPSSLILHCAKNEVFSFQLHVSSSKPFVLSTDTAPWLHALGHTLKTRLVIGEPVLQYRNDREPANSRTNNCNGDGDSRGRREGMGSCNHAKSNNSPSNSRNNETQEKTDRTREVVDVNTYNDSSSDGHNNADSASDRMLESRSGDESMGSSSERARQKDEGDRNMHDYGGEQRDQGEEETFERRHIEAFSVGFVEDEEGNMVMEYFDRSQFSQKASKAHAIFVRCRVPSTAAAGVYEIGLYFFSQLAGFCDERLMWKGVALIHVMDVRLPPPQQWSFHLDLWQHHSSIARAHGVQLWSDRHFELIDRYLESLAQLGQKDITIVATESPWAGQLCFLEKDYPSALYEFAAIRVSSRGGKGSAIHLDFSMVERLLQLADRHGINGDIEVFGLMSIWSHDASGFGGVVDGAPDCWRIRCLNQVDGSVRYLRDIEEIKGFLRGCHAFFKEKGYLDRVRVCVDEPSDMKLFYEQLDFLRSVAPGFKLRVAINHFEFMKYAPVEMVDCVPLLPLVCESREITRELRQHVHQYNGKLLWYVCSVPAYPNSFISSPLVETQLIGWMTFFLNLDGFLRWNFCLWPAEPWQSLRWRPQYWRVGDMYFVLPGKDGAPVETLRYEALRRAIQDYELLRLADRTVGEEEKATLFEKVRKLIFRTDKFADFREVGKSGVNREDLYSLDPASYTHAKRLLLEAISRSNRVQEGDVRQSRQDTTMSMGFLAEPQESTDESDEGQGDRARGAAEQKAGSILSHTQPRRSQRVINAMEKEAERRKRGDKGASVASKVGGRSKSSTSFHTMPVKYELAPAATASSNMLP